MLNITPRGFIVSGNSGELISCYNGKAKHTQNERGSPAKGCQIHFRAGSYTYH